MIATIFDLNVLQEEINAIIFIKGNSKITKENYLNFVEGLAQKSKLDVGYIYLVHLSNLFDAELRNNRIKSLEYFEKAQKEYPDSFHLAFNE